MQHDVTSNKRYWEQFYRQNLLLVPSQFCAMVSTEVGKEPTMVEFGCGNGRDSLYFGSQRHQVFAMDLAHEAIQACKDKAQENHLDNVHFQQGDLTNLDDIVNIVENARTKSETADIIGYSRFVMHSINDEQQAAFMANVSKTMKSGELFYFEFRSKEDAALEKVFGNHYRRFVDTDDFVKCFTEDHGYKLLYRLTGRGMAKYKNEDPVVSRLIFEKL